MGRYAIYNRHHLDRLLDELETEYERELILGAFDALVEDPDTPQVTTYPLRGDQSGADRMIAELPLSYYVVFKVHPNGIMPSTRPAIALYGVRRLDDPR